MVLWKWKLAFICALAAASVAGGFWLWHITRPVPRVWLRVHSLKDVTGDSSKIDLEAWVPADPDVARLASEASAELQAKHRLVCGGYFGASLTFVDAPQGGRFLTKLGPDWPSESLQRIARKRIFAAQWIQEHDGSIRVVTRDPLILERHASGNPIPGYQDLWVEVEVPRRGGLKAVALGVREGSGSYRPITL